MAITVIDYEGNERDVEYLVGKYGGFLIKPADSGPAWRIVKLVEKVNAPASLVVTVRVVALPVAFYWPDAPQDANAGPRDGVFPQMVPGRCVHGTTNENGDAGFGMGQGSYYWPDKGEIGPHAAWIYGADTPSDVILGLGMVAATNHDHFDVGFAWVEEEDPEPPEPPPSDWLELIAALDGVKVEAGRLGTQVWGLNMVIQALIEELKGKV